MPPGDVEVLPRRIWAHALDNVLPFGLALPVVVALDADTGVWAWPAATVAIWVLNVFVLQAYTGQSLGKLLLGIRTVDANGRRPGLVRSFKRGLPLLIEWIAIFGFVAMIRHPHAQRLGDRWAGTYVIRAGR